MPDREDRDDDRESPDDLDPSDDEEQDPHGAAGAQVVCPRCGAVQLRAVSCRDCSTPLGEYAVQRRSRLDAVRDGLDELRDRGLLLPIVGAGAALAMLALILIIAVSGPGSPSAAAPPDRGPFTAPDGTPLPAPPPDPDTVRAEDLENLIDPRAEALLEAPAPADDEAPYAAVIRIKSGVTGELFTRARYDRKLRKKRWAVVRAALPRGWVLYASGPQVARIQAGRSRRLKPGRYELAAEKPGAAAAEARPRFALLGLEPGYRYTVSDQPVKKRRRGRRRR